jgi:hypothetical protein
MPGFTFCCPSYLFSLFRFASSAHTRNLTVLSLHSSLTQKKNICEGRDKDKESCDKSTQQKLIYKTIFFYLMLNQQKNTNNQIQTKQNAYIYFKIKNKKNKFGLNYCTCKKNNNKNKNTQKKNYIHKKKSLDKKL